MEKWNPRGPNRLDLSGLPQDRAVYAFFLQPVREEAAEGGLIFKVTENRRRHRAGGEPGPHKLTIEDGKMVRMTRTPCHIANAELEGSMVRVRREILDQSAVDDLEDEYVRVAVEEVTTSYESKPDAVVFDETYLAAKPVEAGMTVARGVWPHPECGATHVRIGVVYDVQYQPDGTRTPVEPLVLVPIEWEG